MEPAPVINVDRLVAVVRTLANYAIGAAVVYVVAIATRQLGVSVDLNGPQVIAIVGTVTAAVYSLARYLESEVPLIGRLAFIISSPPSYRNPRTSQLAGTVRTLVNSAVVAAVTYVVNRYALEVDLNDPIIVNIVFVVSAVVYPLSLYLVDRVPILGRLLFAIGAAPEYTAAEVVAAAWPPPQIESATSSSAGAYDGPVDGADEPGAPTGR